MTSNNGWEEWRRLVLDKLETLESGQENMRSKLDELRTEMAVQKVKSGAWGAVSGAVTVSMLYLAEKLLGHKP